MALILDIATSNEWHLQKGGTEYGPYSYEDIIKMLQDHHVFESDYVWSPHLDKWAPLGTLVEFSVDRISRLAEKSKNGEVFSKRQHERERCQFAVTVHKNLKHWSGTFESISVGGGLLLMRNPLILPGEVITIHCEQNKNIKTPFNAKAEIIAKRLVKGKIEHDTEIYYAVKFLQLQPVGEAQINLYIKTIKTETTKGDLK